MTITEGIMISNIINILLFVIICLIEIISLFVGSSSNKSGLVFLRRSWQKKISHVKYCCLNGRSVVSKILSMGGRLRRRYQRYIDVGFELKKAKLLAFS